jgi:hypothetical protein
MQRFASVLSLLIAPAVVCAQGSRHQSNPVERPVWTGVSARAVAQLREVEDALRPLATREAANDRGFAPVFGWIPTMGVHWVNDARMVDGKLFELNTPDQLMFSRVHGRETLVGAAYAYLAPLSDTVRPTTFDGNPSWHEHRNLAPEGQTLVMLHIWFVPSPDGPFAENNPNLPFWAMNLTPPDAARLNDAVSGPRVRKAALAIGEVVDSAGRFPLLQRRNLRLAAQLGTRRENIRQLIPELDARQKAGDWPAWGRVAERLAAEWDAMREAYLAGAPDAQARARMQKALDELAGMHGAIKHNH